MKYKSIIFCVHDYTSIIWCMKMYILLKRKSLMKNNGNFTRDAVINGVSSLIPFYVPFIFLPHDSQALYKHFELLFFSQCKHERRKFKIWEKNWRELEDKRRSFCKTWSSVRLFKHLKLTIKVWVWFLSPNVRLLAFKVFKWDRSY